MTAPLTMLKVVSCDTDFLCLIDNWEHPHAPSQTYGIVNGVSFWPVRSVLHRRYSLTPSELWIEPGAVANIVAGLATHEEAQLLMLTPGEFLGLQISAWRDAHKITDRGLPPSSYWSVLDLFALYKRARAYQDKRRDDGKRIEAARVLFRRKYEPHRELIRRQARGESVH